jgi:hypothetical protein
VNAIQVIILGAIVPFGYNSRWPSLFLIRAHPVPSVVQSLRIIGFFRLVPTRRPEAARETFADTYLLAVRGSQRLIVPTL